MNQEEVKRRTAAATEKALAHARQGRLGERMSKQIEAAWAQLDVAVDEVVRLTGMIKDVTADGDKELAKSFEFDLAMEQARARGKAEILALIMPAPYNTADAVSAEAGLRYQAKQRGEVRQTPGIRFAGGTLAAGIEPGRVLTEAEHAERYR